ncbi:PREDICTED: glutathione gamma-glutamylcysteinyltransferase 2 [Camelina sativa]|uniref:glutathione gamma-glutamylcysteinyltransferase n=1 Tax=Camelina sativa TaxID=90675 RepID=A0ABM0VK37_CAMSA|nr:PREDICTED: glutathione gamma-glutamylcysteinyltransferase 2 [Camelina sativa]
MSMVSLYRRSLTSPPAIDFASVEGKQIFNEALQKGTMEGFFRLISYFQTQSEPAFCGLASLSMVLNALSIDPGRKWKGPWRWFDESMLECCEPLEIVKDKGISFGKVVCLAHSSGAKVEAFRTNQSTIDDFRKLVVKCSTSDNCHMISTYHRELLKQTGTGHFSPIGGYNAERDMALILDVARFKYPPHWVPLKLLWDAMDSIDQSTGRRRGFMLISRPHREPGLLYTLSCKDESWISIAKYLKEDVPRLVSSQHVDTIERILYVVFKSLPADFSQFIRWMVEVRRIEDFNQNLSSEEKSRLDLKQELLKQVQETKLFKHVDKFLSSVNYEDNLPYVSVKVYSQGGEILSGNESDETCCEETCVKCIKGLGEEKMTVKAWPSGNDVFTALLLALPSQTWSGIKDQSLLQEMKQLISMVNLPTLLQQEVLHLRRQLELLKRCQENKEEEELCAPA